MRHYIKLVLLNTRWAGYNTDGVPRVGSTQGAIRVIHLTDGSVWFPERGVVGFIVPLHGKHGQIFGIYVSL